jgi:hypothetical protein
VRHWQKLTGNRVPMRRTRKPLHNIPNSLSLRFRMPFNTLRLMEKLRVLPRPISAMDDLGDGVNQAAALASSATSIPSRNLTHSMTFDNWF